jgi:hypothetical protein
MHKARARADQPSAHGAVWPKTRFDARAVIVGRSLSGPATRGHQGRTRQFDLWDRSLVMG